MQNHFDESTLIGGPRKNVFYCNIVLEMFDVEVKHSFCTVDFFFFFRCVFLILGLMPAVVVILYQDHKVS